jgi:hypothetical protein
MTDPEELQLKAKIDEIMKSVDNIMTRVETVLPKKEKEPHPQRD